MSAEPQPAVVTTRTRHENSSSLGSAKTREALFSVGALGVGALGGYYLVDYIIRTQAIEKLLARFGITLNGNGNGTTNTNTNPLPPEDDDTNSDLAQVTETSNFAHIAEDPRPPYEIFDRTTRVNSYAARKLNRKPQPLVEDGIDITRNQEGAVFTENEFNQIVTDDNVYNSF